MNLLPCVDLIMSELIFSLPTNYVPTNLVMHLCMRINAFQLLSFIGFLPSFTWLLSLLTNVPIGLIQYSKTIDPRNF